MNLSLLLLLPISTSGFLGLVPPMNKPLRKPDLERLADLPSDLNVSIKLDVGQAGSVCRLAVKSMNLKLKNSAPSSTDNCVAMPGIDGPHPYLSSGHREVDVVQRGEFVSLQGVQHVQALNGSWEMVWNDRSPAGTILCGFEIPQDYTRNEAVLPKGKLYLSFPIWTKESFAEALREKEEILSRAEELLNTKREALEKYQEERNPILKALHFREAVKATERYGYQPLQRVERIPGKEDVVNIKEDVLLTTNGLAWTTSPASGEQILLGTASLSVQPEFS